MKGLEERRMMSERRGELTTTQIAILIFAILGFIVVLFFISQLGFESLTKKEVCKLSVITRGTVPESAETYVPLKCSTEKICLKNGDSNCELSFAGEKMQPAISLDGNSEKAAEQVAEASAKAMYDCWSMMGEGKIDLFTSLSKRKGLSASDSACVICSRIAIDAGTRNDEILSKVNLAEYLQTHQVPQSSLTYLQAFTDKSVSSYASVDEGTIDKTIGEAESVNYNIKGDELEVAVIFMQIKPNSYTQAFSELISLGGTIAGPAFIIAPKTTSTIAWTIAKAIGRHPYIALITAAGATGYVSFNVYAGRSAAAGYCGEVTAPGRGNINLAGGVVNPANGCSMVEVLPYDAKSINKLCSHIESAP